MARIKAPNLKAASLKTAHLKTPDPEAPDLEAPNSKTPNPKTPNPKTPNSKTPSLRTPSIKAGNLSDQLESLGEFIAAQRRAAELSLRQLAEQAGVSNPYLSQIERGLRKPSAEVLQQLSRALRISAEQLYVRAGILDPDDHRSLSVEMAVLADEAISERQKRVLIDVYNSFVAETAAKSETLAKSEAGD